MEEPVSGDKYRFLESIFSWEEEIEFLETQPGYHPSMGIRHRKAKKKLAWRWISELRVDFEELHREAILVLITSHVDRPDLLRALWQLKLNFYYRLALLELRLLCRCPVTNRIRSLSTVLEHLIGYTCIVREEMRVPAM